MPFVHSFRAYTLAMAVLMALAGCISLNGGSRNLEEMMQIGKCANLDHCRRIIDSANNTLATLRNPVTASHYADRTVAHITLDHREQARKEFEHVVELNGDRDVAIYATIKSAFSSEYWVEERAYAEGWEQVARRNYGKALHNFDVAMERQFQPPGLIVGYAIALCESGQCASGRQRLEEALRRNPRAFLAFQDRIDRIRGSGSPSQPAESVFQLSSSGKDGNAPSSSPAALAIPSQAYYELTGACPKLKDPVTAQAGLKDLGGVFQKQHGEGTDAGTYVQVRVLKDGYLQLIEGMAVQHDGGTVSGRSSFGAFLPVGAEKNGVAAYLGFIRRDEPFFGDAWLGWFGEKREKISLEGYAPLHTCNLVLLIKGKGYFSYHEFGLNKLTDSDWSNLEQSVRQEGGRIERDQVRRVKIKHVTTPYIRDDAEEYLKVVKQTLRMFVMKKAAAFLGAQSFVAVMPEEDPIKLAAQHLERGRAYLTSSQPSRAVEEFGQALRYVPGNASSYMLRGVAHFAAQELDAGAIDVDKALSLDKGNGKLEASPFVRDSLLLHGALLEQAGKRSEAFRDYDIKKINAAFDTYENAAQFLPHDGKAEYAFVLLSAKTRGAAKGKALRACERIARLATEYADCFDKLNKAWYPRVETERSPHDLMIGTLMAIGAVSLLAILSGEGHHDDELNAILDRHRRERELAEIAERQYQILHDWVCSGSSPPYGIC